MSNVDDFIKNIVYKDKKHIVFEDMTVYDIEKDKTYPNNLNLSYKEGFTNKHQRLRDQNLFDIVTSPEGKNLKGTIYTAPYIEIKFSPQEMAEGDHGAMYLMHNGVLMVEERQNLELRKYNKTEVLHKTNIHAISKWLNQKFKETNKAKLQSKMRFQND
jgi:hypothetical protein